MAITNYGELKSAVADWAERSDLTTRIEDFCQIAHTAIARELVLNFELDLDSGDISTPNDFGSVVSLMATAAPAVVLRSASETDTTYIGGTGVPRAYRVDSGDLLLFPTPDVTYAGRLLYRMSRTFFTADTQTNTALDRYPNLYLHGALAELMRFLRDPDGQATYEGSFKAGLLDAIRGETAQHTQGLTLQTTSGNVV